ncbi:MAG: Ig-like domain-containing protein [Colwellia sp.]|nr:Ig-like domain-containing protein [Colwellia sp.]
MYLTTTSFNKISVPVLRGIVLTSLTLTLSACNSGDDATSLTKAVELEIQRSQGTIIESVTITGGQFRLKVGEIHQLRATGVDSNGETRDITSELTWISSDSDIATVDNKGLVTAEANSDLNRGIVLITGTTINDIFAEAEISVSDVNVAGLTLQQYLPESGNVLTCIDAKITGNVTYEDDYQSLNTVTDISFSVDDDSTAIINDQGMLYTSNELLESTTVTGLINNISAQITVIADPSNLDSIDILLADESTKKLSFNVGERISVNAQANLTSTTTATNIDNSISWQQRDTNLIGITAEGDNKGTLLALKPGISELSANCGGKKATATLEIKGNAEITALTVNDNVDTLTLANSESIELTLTASFTDNTATLNVSEFADWNLNGSDLVSAELISLGTDQATYKITNTANAAGELILSVTYDGLSKIIDVTVE